ncbi:MAG: calcium-translocating P-type ATPase, PMCA-type [Clostridia bacterium]|jgi:Ca2+-transporting ATPase|nr:calcium-translocating P-type ATPase, PMCA-type [Clostridia bacterium]
MEYYRESANQALEALQSRREGLSSEEAQQRQKQYGPNRLAEAKKDSVLVRFFKQMNDPMTLILIAAAILSGITAAYAHESFSDVIIIMAVVIVNAALGVYQEGRAEKAIEELQQMAAATSRVLRDGKVCVLRSENLVPGDIILLEAGDAIPADARVLECASLKLEEAALTGESLPVEKTADALSGDDIVLGDRRNMVYLGSTVVYGHGRAVVTGIGMNTEMGKIADVLSQAGSGETPLQRKLSELSRILTFLVLGICVVIFGCSIMRTKSLNFDTMIDLFMVAVSLAVAAIPEGLATVVTIVLSIGVTNMSKRNAIVRRLTAVETLGCAQIICSDKTGTLTQNKMTVTESYGNDEKLLGTAMALCCDVEASNEGALVGDPTEVALVVFAETLGLPKAELERNMPRVAEAPFDSIRKMMSTVHEIDGDFMQFTKGAPDVVLSHCTTYWEDGKEKPLTEAKRSEILAANKAMADKALRVLAAAQRWYDEAPEGLSPENLEEELCFLGLTGMIDPVRPEIKDAIVECREAGIRPVMITGDHLDTAVAIAKELGILTEGLSALTGNQLNAISEEELLRDIEKYAVYARVQPEHKVRIVDAWRSRGYVTAMTGDGVNDAPSLKRADIGVGMGITGTDVTKNVADMVLADDNFATIVGAVEEGRRIYDNIRKAIQFLLASNMSEVLSVFAATMLGFTILRPVHLLWINLITDCFPALALGIERGERDLMQRKPRSPNEGVFARGLGVDVLYQGMLITLLTLAAYFIGHYMESGAWEIVNSPDGVTMAFLTMSMAEIFHSFNMRSQRGSVFAITYQNAALWLAFGVSLLLTTAVIYVPALAAAFQFETVSLAEYFVALLLALSIIPMVEIVKAFLRGGDR